MSEVKTSPKISIEYEVNGKKQTVNVTDLLSDAVEVLKYFKENIPAFAEAKAIREEPLISTEELAEYLHKSTSCIANWKRQKLIPYYTAGRSIYYKKTEVEIALRKMTATKVQIVD